jgi:hypothetical protein
VPQQLGGYQAGMEKREHSVPDAAPGVELPDDNDGDDLRDADGLEKLGKTLSPEDDDEE